MTTAADICNEALWLMGDKTSPITGAAPNFDDSVPGKAARLLYAPVVAAVARTYEWDMARREVALTPTVNTAALGFAYEYLYPSNGIEVWQLRAAVVDPYNPLPVNYVVGNAMVGAPAVQTKVIWTNVQNARAVYNNNPDPNVWDAGFRQAVVRLLASEFATALAARIETSADLFESAQGARAMAQGRDA